jgi:two-component system CheB/CheR fusion protein
MSGPADEKHPNPNVGESSAPKNSAPLLSLPPPSGSSPSDSSPPASEHEEQFVVGIGASAGGLEAITELLKNLPHPLEFAAVVVQHMDPSHESHLVDILARSTPAPVTWAENGQAIEPGRIYVAPPRVCLTVRNRVIVFGDERSRTGEIDFFFRSLAEDLKDSAVGVILSGSGTDGMQGCRAIKAAGGLVFAQELATAKYPSMPQASINARCVDLTLAPAAIAGELGKLTRESVQLWKQIGVRTEPETSGGEAEQLASIFRLLASRTGVDFSEYKPSTIRRRLVRRMMLAKVTELGDYLKLLLRNREEQLMLYETLLINVTEFFRDPESFEFLRQQVLPAIIK